MSVVQADAGRVMRPTSLAEAVAIRATRNDARVVGGGTLVVAERSLGIDSPEAYLLLSGVSELHGLSADGPGVRIGAHVTLNDLLAADIAPMLTTALRSLATPQIRNRATVGGNIAERRPAHTLAPCFLALDARVGIASAAGIADRSFSEFLTTGIAGDELIASVLVPGGSGFQRFTRVAGRNGPGYAIASVALSIDSASRSVRTGLGGVGPTALLAAAADDFLAGAIDWEAGTAPSDSAEEYGRLLAECAEPASDDRATSAYRRHAVAVMGRRLIETWTEEQRRG